MYEHIRCVSLRTIKYDDKHSIVTAWSAERGRVGLLVSSGSSREACRRRALMMPMGIFEAEADFRPGRELLNIRDVRPIAVLPSVSSSPAKAVVAMFLAEVLDKVLRDTPPDDRLAEYIFQSVITLDSIGARGAANFPLVFLCRLSGFLGIEPDFGEWEKGMIFDMNDGVYRPSAPVNGLWLNAEESAVAAMVQRLTYSTGNRLRLSRSLRRRILEKILEYYSIHLASLESLRSLAVVTELL